MRADRLLAILLLLQNRGRTTADKLADELEVSVRTIYRDVDALCIAGVPIYTDRGPGGGISLLDSYRTTLTGLKDDELLALFLLSIPTPLAELGFSQQLKGALTKLRAALPVEKSEIGNGIHQRVLLDWVGWHRTAEQVPHLRAIQQAVWENCLLEIQYRSTFRDQITKHVLAPYSLVAKAGIWYLVGVTSQRKRVYRISRIVNVKQLTENFTRPANYNLHSYWQDWCKVNEERQTLFRVLARIDPNLQPYLPLIFGEQIKDRIKQKSPVRQDSWMTVELYFESLEVARGLILNCGHAIEIVEPYALRLSVIDYARQISDFYSSLSGNDDHDVSSAP